jgi:hypothetical protein
MVTVLWVCNTEKQRSVVFFVKKKTTQRIFIKKYFLFTARTVLSRKAVHNGVEKFSQGRSEVADDETELRKWLRQQ